MIFVCKMSISIKLVFATQLRHCVTRLRGDGSTELLWGRRIIGDEGERWKFGNGDRTEVVILRMLDYL